MELYEFVNMSDKITFWAKNDEYARAVTLILGEGKAGCRKQDGTSVEYCMTAFHGSAPKEVYQQLNKMLEEKDKDLANAFMTVAVCDFSDREIYDDYTQKGENEEKWVKWDNSHRSSLNNFGLYARKVAKMLRGEKAE